MFTYQFCSTFFRLYLITADLIVNVYYFLGSKELDLLNEGANVYKLIGPVLVKQDLAEANANVRKRIEYISAELYDSSFIWFSVYVTDILFGLRKFDPTENYKHFFLSSFRS